VLNLADPKVAKHMEDSIMHVVKDFKVDFYKLDYNIETYEGGQNLKDGYLEHQSWRHFDVLYRVHERILKEFPDVVLENCSSGGGRNDLGMLSRFHYACESDMSTHPLGLRAINALSLFLPPEAICYYHNHVYYAHQTTDLDTHLRITLFVTPVFVGFGAQDADRTTEYFKKTKRYIELSKTFCRPIMANQPVVYHHTPDIGLLNPADWCVLEYAAQDRSRSYAGVFKLNTTGPNEYVFRPKGIDPSRDYNVTLDNSKSKVRVSGWELANTGVRVRLDGALTSELLLFKVAE
jgi:alpha-galactosidase